MTDLDIKSILRKTSFEIDRFGRRYPYRITLLDGSTQIGSYARSISLSDGSIEEVCFKIWDDINLWLENADYLSGKMKCLKPEEITAIDVWLGH